MMAHSELYEQVAGIYSENSRQRNAFESIFAFYADALDKATQGDLEALQQAKQVSVLAAGPVGYFDALALAILLPHAHISISDLETRWVDDSANSFARFLNKTTRREVRADLESRVSFDVKDATDPSQLTMGNDLTIVRNPGGTIPGTTEEIVFPAMFGAARQITRDDGLVLVSFKTEREAAIHQEKLALQPMKMVYNGPATETNVYGLGGDVHLFAARV